MAMKDDLEEIVVRLGVLESLAIAERLKKLEKKVRGLVKWTAAARVVLLAVPAMVGVLYFLDWWISDSASKPSPIDQVVCETCLYDPVYDEWHCGGCIPEQEAK